MRSPLRALLLLLVLAGCSRSGHMLQSPGAGKSGPQGTQAAINGIVGHVYDGTNGNAPVPGVLVTAVQYDTSTSLPFEFSTFVSTHNAVTDADGHYEIDGPPDGIYLVYVRPALSSFDDVQFAFAGVAVSPHATSLVPQWHDGSDLTAAGAVHAAHNPVVVGGGNASLQNFTLHRDTRTWTGATHHEMSGLPAPGQHVVASTLIGIPANRTLIVSETVTDAGGQWLLQGLPNAADITGQFTAPPDPSFPAYRQIARVDHPLLGNDPRLGIQCECVPKTLGPGPTFIYQLGSLEVGGANDDGPDADNGAADVTRLEVTQFAKSALYDSLVCSVGNELYYPQTYRVDIALRESPALNVKYRLHVLMTDNLALTGYSDVLIQTYAPGAGHIVNGNLPQVGLTDEGNGDVTALLGNGPGASDSGDGPPPPGGILRLSDEKGGPPQSAGFLTQGPALATDVDEDGDPADPTHPKISWFIDIAQLGSLSGGGSGFYLYVETIGVAGGGGKQDVAPNAAGKPNKSAPLFVRIHPVPTLSGICGKTGVI